MICLEALRERIACWVGRIRASFGIRAHKIDVSGVKMCDIIWGISTCPVAAVIVILLIVGGIELNPGPLWKDTNYCSVEETIVPSQFEFDGAGEGNYVF